MKKLRFMSLAVAAVLCAGFASCSDDSDEELQNSNENTYDPANPKVDQYGIAVSQEVDLGLSVKWASWNIGATRPEEYGGYYAWGETEEKDVYSWGTYRYVTGNPIGIPIMTKYNDTDGKTVLDPEDDVAHVKWNNGWRMPTAKEITELCYECTWERIKYNRVYGYKVTGKELPNGKQNSIFLPCTKGEYWSSSLSYEDDRAVDWKFYSDGYSDIIITDNSCRLEGYSVRAVKNL